MAVRQFLHLSPPPESIRSFADVASYLRRMWDALKLVRRGKIECVTQVTLAAGVTTTALVDERLSVQSVVIFDPQTAVAASELYGGTMYVLTANRGTGTWTITHSNSVSTTRTFQVAIIG